MANIVIWPLGEFKLYEATKNFNQISVNSLELYKTLNKCAPYARISLRGVTDDDKKKLGVNMGKCVPNKCRVKVCKYVSESLSLLILLLVIAS